MDLKPLAIGLGVAATVAAAVASVATFVDWRRNPGGIFRSDVGTNGLVVWETWISWFWPVFLFVAVVAAAVAVWRTMRR